MPGGSRALCLGLALATTSCSAFTFLGDLVGGKDEASDATREGSGDRAGNGAEDELGADPFADAKDAEAPPPPSPVPPVGAAASSSPARGSTVAIRTTCTGSGALVSATSPTELRAKACNLGSATAEDNLGAGLGSGASGFVAGEAVSSCLSLTFEDGSLSRVRVRLRATGNACGTYCVAFGGGQCAGPSAKVFVGASANQLRLAGTFAPTAQFADYEVDVPVDAENTALVVAICTASVVNANLIEVDAVRGVCT